MTPRSPARRNFDCPGIETGKPLVRAHGSEDLGSLVSTGGGRSVGVAQQSSPLQESEAQIHAQVICAPLVDHSPISRKRLIGLALKRKHAGSDCPSRSLQPARGNAVLLEPRELLRDELHVTHQEGNMGPQDGRQLRLLSAECIARFESKSMSIAKSAAG